VVVCDTLKGNVKIFLNQIPKYQLSTALPTVQFSEEQSSFRNLCPVLESSENWTLFKEFLMTFMVLTLTFIMLLTSLFYKFSLMTVKIFITFKEFLMTFIVLKLTFITLLTSWFYKLSLKTVKIFITFKEFLMTFIGYLPFRWIPFRQNPFWRKTDLAKSYLVKAVSAKKFKFLFHLIKLFLIHYYNQISINNI
jgi:hypothetical protein